MQAWWASQSLHNTAALEFAAAAAAAAAAASDIRAAVICNKCGGHHACMRSTRRLPQLHCTALHCATGHLPAVRLSPSNRGNELCNSSSDRLHRFLDQPLLEGSLDLLVSTGRQAPPMTA